MGKTDVNGRSEGLVLREALQKERDRCARYVLDIEEFHAVLAERDEKYQRAVFEEQANSERALAKERKRANALVKASREPKVKLVYYWTMAALAGQALVFMAVVGAIALAILGWRPLA